MRKGNAILPPSKKKSHYQPSSSKLVRCFPLALAIQLFLLCMIALALYGAHFGGMQLDSPLHRDDYHHNPRPDHSHVSPKTENDAKLQLRFLEKADSWLAQVYHDEHFPPLNGTTEKLKAIPLASFCRQRLAKSRPKYAIFRDVMLVERKLYLPSTIDCSKFPRNIFLTTRFNRGQRSTPNIEVMVVPSADTFEGFEPHLSCHERVYEPSVLFSFINWPQYGHAMFNGISLLWEIFDGPLSNASKNVRLYAYGDSIDSHQRQEAQEYFPFFDLKAVEPLMNMFSHQPVRALANLLMQSDRHPVCFSYLVVGLSGDLDHYNFRAPLRKWREFAVAVKSHFNVSDPPRRIDVKLQRVAPQNALQGSDPDELGDIKGISFKDLPDRPRLTMVDRKGSRVIMNIKELERIAAETGYFKSVVVAYLEEMKMEEQMELMGSTDVLMGMDGTGMMNGIFLPEGGVVVHVRPYGCSRFLPGKGINFNRLWAANPGRIIRHESGDRKSTRFPTNIAEVPKLVFSPNSSHSYRFPFILKQDTVIDPLAFRCILDACDKLLHAIPVDWPANLACTRSVS